MAWAVEDMSGKRVVVTGANSGIGRITAKELAKAGAETILVCRSAERGDEALEAIREETGSDRVTLMLCDISSRADLRRFGGEFRRKYDSLDVLVNNAGAYFADLHRTSGDHELTFSLNHMGYFQMVHELRACLEGATAGRVVNVSSEGHRLGGLNWDDLQWSSRRYRAMRAYCDSKLMNILFTRELARRLSGSSVTANCLHPGVIRSGFATGERGAFAFLAGLSRPFLSSPERGARTSIYLASSSEVDGVTGQYFVSCRRRRPAKAARNDDDAVRLWELSEGILEASQD